VGIDGRFGPCVIEGSRDQKRPVVTPTQAVRLGEDERLATGQRIDIRGFFVFPDGAAQIGAGDRIDHGGRDDDVRAVVDACKRRVGVHDAVPDGERAHGRIGQRGLIEARHVGFGKGAAKGIELFSGFRRQRDQRLGQGQTREQQGEQHGGQAFHGHPQGRLALPSRSEGARGCPPARIGPFYGAAPVLSVPESADTAFGANGQPGRRPGWASPAFF